MSLKYNILYSSLLLLGACGTVFSGTSQKINFDSNINENIEIYVNGRMVCNQTPCSAEIERDSAPLTIMAKAQGYEDTIVYDRSRINKTAIGNLFSVYSWTTDFVSGAVWKYSEDGVYLNMRKKNMTKSEATLYNQTAKIKAFALYNFAELKINNPEYIKALEEITGKDRQKLASIIQNSSTEVELADNLINSKIQEN